MHAISLKISDRELQLSNEAASTLGLNRSEFIRRAIQHESRRLQIDRMAKSMADISRDPKFMAEFKEWEDSTIGDGLADEDTDTKGWFTISSKRLT